MSKIKGVLTAAQIKDIRQAQKILTDAVPIVEAAEECGVDCAERKAQMATLMDYFDKVLARFEGGKGK